MFPSETTEVPFHRRTFNLEDPYNGRNEFKETQNSDMLLSDHLADRLVNEKEKLDLIFGKFDEIAHTCFTHRNLGDHVVSGSTAVVKEYENNSNYQYIEDKLHRKTIEYRVPQSDHENNKKTKWGHAFNVMAKEIASQVKLSTLFEALN